MGKKDSSPQTESPTLTIETSSEPYFFELVTEAFKSKRIKTQPETEYYLVRLLNRFLFADVLYTKNKEGQREELPLALLYKEAIETEEPQAQRALFQHLGDLSLYRAGFFQESITRAQIDLGYVMGLGGNAYRQVATRSPEKKHQATFEELSHRFEDFVDALFWVSERTSVPKSEVDAMRMLNLWKDTGSERAARILHSLGIRVKGTK